MWRPEWRVCVKDCLKRVHWAEEREGDVVERKRIFS